MNCSRGTSLIMYKWECVIISLYPARAQEHYQIDSLSNIVQRIMRKGGNSFLDQPNKQRRRPLIYFGKLMFPNWKFTLAGDGFYSPQLMFKCLVCRLHSCADSTHSLSLDIGSDNIYVTMIKDSRIKIISTMKKKTSLQSSETHWLTGETARRC